MSQSNDALLAAALEALDEDPDIPSTRSEEASVTGEIPTESTPNTGEDGSEGVGFLGGLADVATALPAGFVDGLGHMATSVADILPTPAPRAVDDNQARDILAPLGMEDEWAGDMRGGTPEEGGGWKATTTVGGLVHDIAEFSVGLLAVNRGLKAVNILQKAAKGTTIARTMVESAAATSLTVDPDQETMTQQLRTASPLLAAVLPSWMEIKQEDMRWEKRAKHMLEDLGMSAVFELVAPVGRSLFAWGKAKRAGMKGAALEEAQAQAEKELTHLAAAATDPQALKTLEEKAATPVVRETIQATSPTFRQVVKHTVTKEQPNLLTDILVYSQKPGEMSEGLTPLLKAAYEQTDDPTQAFLAMKEEIAPVLDRATPETLTVLANNAVKSLEVLGLDTKLWTEAIKDAPALLDTIKETLLPAQFVLASSYRTIQKQACTLAYGNATPRDFLRFEAAWNDLMGLQRHFSNAKTAAGRLLSSFRIGARVRADGRVEPFFTKMGKGTDAYFTAARINAMSDAEVAEYLAKHKGVQARIQTTARLTANMTPEQAIRYLGRIRPTTTLGVARELFVHSILSGPHTHAWNIVSNMAKLAWNDVDKTAGGLLTGQWDVAKEGAVQLAAKARFTLEALEMFGESLWHDQSFFDSMTKTELMGSFPQLSYEAMMARRPDGGELWQKFARLTGAAGKLTAVSGRLMTAEDEFFKQLSARSELFARTLTESKAVLGKNASWLERVKWADARVTHYFDAQGRLKTLDDELAEATARKADETELASLRLMRENAARALQHAQEATFTQRSTSQWVRATQKLVADHPSMGFVLPFVRTPANLIADAVAHTPLVNLALKSFREEFKQGGEARALVVGKFATGLTLLGTAYGLARAGMITGAEPKDPALLEKWRMEGIQPYALRTENGWVSYKKGDPASMLIGTTATLAGNVWDEEGGFKEDAFTHLLIATADNLTDKTFFKGVTDIMDAVSHRKENWLARYLGRTAASIVPYSGLRSWNNRMEDNSLREALGFVESAMMTLNPSSLPLSYNWITGEVMTGAGSFFTAEQQDPVLEELDKLGGVLQAPGRNVMNQELTSEQYSRLKQLCGTVRLDGRTLHQSLRALFRSAAYKRMPDAPAGYDGPKQRAVHSIMMKYREAAALTLRKEMPEVNQTYLREQVMREGTKSGAITETNARHQVSLLDQVLARYR